MGQKYPAKGDNQPIDYTEIDHATHQSQCRIRGENRAYRELDIESYHAGLAEWKELENNEISATGKTPILPAANTNQPLEQVDNMSVKNTCANYSIEPSNHDVYPYKNSDLTHNQRLDGVNNAALLHRTLQANPYSTVVKMGVSV